MCQTLDFSRCHATGWVEIYSFEPGRGSYFQWLDSPCQLVTPKIKNRIVLFRELKLFIYKSYCSTVHFRRITSIYQPTNAHIISHKTLLKHFKTFRHVSILSDHHQGALFLAKVILQYSQFNSYLQTRCCGSISCCVGMRCGAVAKCASYDAHLANYMCIRWLIN